MSRILLAAAGASYSTKDVETGYLDALRRAGHEVILYALDARIEVAGSWLHHAWEQGGRATPEPTAADVIYQASVGIVEKALRHEPDWVLAISGMLLHPDAVILTKRAGLRVALLLTESPYDDPQQAKALGYADCGFTNERTSVARLRAANPNVWYLGACYDPRRHRPEAPADEPDAAAHDAVFVGTGFPERTRLLAGVPWRALGIDLGLYGQWETVDDGHPLRPYVRGGVTDNRTTAALYRKAKVGLNLYRRDVDFDQGAGDRAARMRVRMAESLNPRAVELAACGAYHVSDRRREVAETFGDFVPTFDGPDELADALRDALAHPERRRDVAAELPGCVAGMSFDDRARELVARLESLA